MKFLMAAFLCMGPYVAFSQTIQLHYDVRHTIDPKNARKNFPVIYFEYFKNQDSGKSFIKPGSFLLKTEADLMGDNDNIAKFYTQVSQSFRFWKPKVFLNLQYSGGLGITEPRQYSYYITNNWAAGLSYPFKWGKSFLSALVNFKIVTYARSSRDALIMLYWWKGIWNYTVEFSGDFSAWTENKNHGDSQTKGLSGKRLFFYAEPQFWLNLNGFLALGTKIQMNYHSFTTENVLQLDPSIGLKCRL